MPRTQCYKCRLPIEEGTATVEVRTGVMTDNGFKAKAASYAASYSHLECNIKELLGKDYESFLKYRERRAKKEVK